MPLILDWPEVKREAFRLFLVEHNRIHGGMIRTLANTARCACLGCILLRTVFEREYYGETAR